MNHTPRFFKRITIEFYTFSKDKWIGHYSTNQKLQDSGCEFTQTKHYVCLIPCFVISFETKRFTKHKKGCWHK